MQNDDNNNDDNNDNDNDNDNYKTLFVLFKNPLYLQ